MLTTSIVTIAVALVVPACSSPGEPEIAIDLHWNVWSAGRAVTCADVNAVSADWLLDGEDDRAFAFTFDCVDRASSRALVPEQVYRLSAKLRRNDGVVIAQCLASYDPDDKMPLDTCDFEVQ